MWRKSLVEQEKFAGASHNRLDILTYDNLFAQRSLTVPHPDLHNRDFLLKLLCQFFPEWSHPVLKKNACELLDDLTTRMPTSFKNENLRRV